MHFCHSMCCCHSSTDLSSSEKGTGSHMGLESAQKRGQVCTWVWNQLTQGDRSAHCIQMDSEKGTGSHMSLESAQKRGQVCTLHPNGFSKGDRFTHEFGISSEKGTGSHMGLESPAAHRLHVNFAIDVGFCRLRTSTEFVEELQPLHLLTTSTCACPIRLPWLKHLKNAETKYASSQNLLHSVCTYVPHPCLLTYRKVNNIQRNLEPSSIRQQRSKQSEHY